MIKRIISKITGNGYKPFGEPEHLAGASQVILENIAFKQARENITSRIVEQWASTRPEEASKREQLYQQICALGDVYSELHLLIHNGTKE